MGTGDFKFRGGREANTIPAIPGSCSGEPEAVA